MKKRILLTLAGIAILLTGAAFVFLTRAPNTTPKATEARAGTPGTSLQGIAVRGRWTIEVKDPDGTTKEVRRFDNALLPEGAAILAQILGRERTPGSWSVLVNYDPTAVGQAGPCAPDGTCFIMETGSASSFRFPTLQRTVQADTITLSGSLVANQDGPVSLVGTAIYHCPPDSSTSACNSSNPSTIFTQHTLANPVSVSSGQQVQVSVELRFMAAP